MNQAIRELPKYGCHKIVHAIKIRDVKSHEKGVEITPEEDGYAPFEVDVEYVRKHNPQVCGYYVVYKDGYKSFSPADVFEDGYKLIK